MNGSLAKNANRVRTLVLILFFPFILHVGSDAQIICKVMFYNTENLFDAVNDSTTDDEEFLPDGARKWTNSRYHKKLDAVSRVIIAAGGWQIPDVVGLCEVENNQVITDLTEHGILAEIGYSFIHYDSPDSRGIDICMLYRPEKVKILTHESWKIPLPDNNALKLRDILFVKTLIGTDTVDFIFCHWPSRRDGMLASSEKRDIVAEFTGLKLDSVYNHSGGTEKIILMGDLNSSPADETVLKVAEMGRLVNLTTGLSQEGKGSYRFRGVWEMIDQVLVSESVIKEYHRENTGCMPEVSVAALNFLMEDDPDYPGQRPFSTYREYKWQGGYSDHLPVLLTICP